MQGHCHSARAGTGAQRAQRQQTQSTAVPGEESEGAVGCSSPMSPGGQWEMSLGEGTAWRQQLQPQAQQPGMLWAVSGPALPSRAPLGMAESKAGASRSPPRSTSIPWIPAPGQSQPHPSHQPWPSLMEQIWGLTVRALLLGFHPQPSGHQPRAFPGTPTRSSVSTACAGPSWGC